MADPSPSDLRVVPLIAWHDFYVSIRAMPFVGRRVDTRYTT